MNEILKQMVECLWSLIMRQSIGNKCLIFFHTAAETRKFVCESYSSCNWGIPWVR